MPPKQSKAADEAARDARTRATALHHAKVIQEQKASRDRVLDTIIDFIDLPSSSSADPARPSAQDVSQLKHSLPEFQKQDFDDLVTERNISEKCGYVLCPKEVKKDAHGPTNRIIWSNKSGSDLKIVPRSELEKWCSKACGARAVFLRAQLNESPSWVNGPLKDEVMLLDEVEARKKGQASVGDGAPKTKQKQEDKSEALVDGIRQLALRDSLSTEDEEALRKLQQLALERGKALRARTLEDVNLVEKKTTEPPRPPEPAQVDGAGSIDGYHPKPTSGLGDDDGEDLLDL